MKAQNLPAKRDAAPREPIDRDADLLGRNNPRSKIRVYLQHLIDDIDRGFQDQSERSDKQIEYWNCYNCKADGNRYYNGIADIYFPIIHDGVEALVTRWANQAFPSAGRYVEVVASDGQQVPALIGLLDHYIRQDEVLFQTNVAQPLIRNAIIEGQLNLYCDWAEIDRVIVSRETHGPRDPDTGQEVPGPEIDDITEEEVRIGFPSFQALHDADVLVMPQTANSVGQALAGGGVAVIVRRWTKPKIKRLVKAGIIRDDEADMLLDEMGKVGADDKYIAKRLLEHCDIRSQGKVAVCWEVWHMLPLDDAGKFDEDGTPRLCRIYIGPRKAILGAKRNPYWNDRCPLLSAPMRKMADVFKGPSFIQYVASLQYEANDAINEGADAATLSAAPVVTRDSEKYNGPLVYNVGAVWDCPPDALRLLEFPDLTPRAQVRVQMALSGIMQSLGVNPSMLPQQTGRPGAKRNQAEVALEQQVDILTASVAVTILEEAIFTPAVGWMVDLDYQFRDTPLIVRMFGEMGKRAEMQQVAPLVNRNGYQFIWRGGNQVRLNAMMLQQGTAWLNVLRGAAPMLQQLGWQVNLQYIIEAQTQNIFGPELGSLTVVNARDNLSIDGDTENEWLMEGLGAVVHPMDDDRSHIQMHLKLRNEVGDPTGLIQLHIMDHMKALQVKANAMAMQMQQAMGGQQQGAMPMGQAGGGGLPQPGAAPAGPRLIKQQPGAIPQDQMPRAGAMVPPRRA